MNLPRRYTVSNPSAGANEKQSKANLEEKSFNKKEFINVKDKNESKIDKITDKNLENLDIVSCVTANPMQAREEKKTLDIKTSSTKKTELINYDSYKLSTLNSKQYI